MFYKNNDNYIENFEILNNINDNYKQKLNYSHNNKSNENITNEEINQNNNNINNNIKLNIDYLKENNYMIDEKYNSNNIINSLNNFNNEINKNSNNNLENKYNDNKIFNKNNNFDINSSNLNYNNNSENNNMNYPIYNQNKNGNINDNNFDNDNKNNIINNNSTNIINEDDNINNINIDLKQSQNQSNKLIKSICDINNNSFEKDENILMNFNINSNNNYSKTDFYNKYTNTNLHRNYLNIDSDYNVLPSNYSNYNSSTQALKTPLREEFHKNYKINNSKNTSNYLDNNIYSIKSYTPDRNLGNNNKKILDLNNRKGYNNSYNYNNKDSIIKNQIISLENKINLYEESFEKTKNQYEEQINNYENQIKIYNNLFLVIYNFLINISKNYIPYLMDKNSNENNNFNLSYIINENELNIKLKIIEDYICKINKDVNDYKFKYQKLLDLDSGRPPLSNKTSLTNNNKEKENEYKKQNSSISDMCDITGNSIYNFNNHPENVFENNFENYQKNSINNNLNNNNQNNKTNLVNGALNNSSINKESNNPFNKENLENETNNFQNQNQNDIYKTLEQRVMMLEKELLLQKSQDNYFYNNLDQINNSNSINQSHYLKLNDKNYINKEIRAKSGPRISSNNRFSYEGSNNDIIMNSNPFNDKPIKKKTKKKKKIQNIFPTHKTQNAGDISNYTSDGINSRQINDNSYNKYSKKIKKIKGKKKEEKKRK